MKYNLLSEQQQKSTLSYILHFHATYFATIASSHLYEIIYGVS